MLPVLADILAVVCLPALLAAWLLRRGRARARALLAVRSEELAALRTGRAELERTSCTDPLTGVWNYRYLQLALDREIARCKRRPDERVLAVLLLEIEGFADIRREHGYQRAGAVLRDLAQRLAMEVREEDVFGRYGGEEFLVLLPETDEKGAMTVADRLSWTVRRHPLALPSVPVHQNECGSLPGNGLSARVGIGLLPRDGSHAALLLRAADKSLTGERYLADTVRQLKSSV
ncbi:GGDEF domain-containing protein [Streptacidiphilus fuscans]|uniref:GGDEF domain-containing protein n=1 Tax=Streptacidiphilus fuscans TaxID=2789292 RepID=A0A931B5I7_9ACTN|nr:GGDEF domain-containing protein [Streptacidiphilus fuscans]MBF9071605.1 GGDEF domain-containing protein [Streptacidiphilus fuscans]MBF9072908.1 GGDEF domain-containing protein [Streptacidiphilus fuscans]